MNVIYIYNSFVCKSVLAASVCDEMRMMDVKTAARRTLADVPWRLRAKTVCTGSMASPGEAPKDRKMPSICLKKSEN